MKTVLIESYLSNLSSLQRSVLLDTMEYIQDRIENAVVSRIFTLPGFTVDFVPICSIRVMRNKQIIRFFQKDVFAVFANKLNGLEYGRCSITINSKNDLKSKEIDNLFKLMVSSAKVDAAFMRAVQMRDYGYYDHRILTPRKNR